MEVTVKVDQLTVRKGIIVSVEPGSIGVNFKVFGGDPEVSHYQPNQVSTKLFCHNDNRAQ